MEALLQQIESRLAAIEERLSTMEEKCTVLSRMVKTTHAVRAPIGVAPKRQSIDAGIMLMA
jgi:hypothetical protein